MTNIPHLPKISFYHIADFQLYHESIFLEKLIRVDMNKIASLFTIIRISFLFLSKLVYLFKHASTVFCSTVQVIEREPGPQ